MLMAVDKKRCWKEERKEGRRKVKEGRRERRREGGERKEDT
jgi:hypothetical protein